MRIPLILAIVMLLVQLTLDTYIFSVAWRRVRKLFWAKFQIAESAFFLVYAIVILCLPIRGDSGIIHVAMWMIFLYLTVYFGKLTFVIFDLLASIPKLFHRKRLSILSWIGAIAAGVLVLSMLWGAFINRFRLQVNEIEIEVPDLPESFAGYRIVQISDLHVGTFGADTTFVAKLVDKVNSLEPNLIVFTGDIVNQKSSELEPFVAPLSRLSAPDGVFSILGNHDYGDYYNWPSPEAKEENMQQLYDLQLAMGWELLDNTSETIFGQNAADSLIIIGVENWGEPPFPQYGNLQEAYPSLADSTVKVLLSHNPMHWVKEIEPVDSVNIALTLSGHTHAMQCEVGGISPAALRYPHCWEGLYSDNHNRKLYVNIGAGTVGFPMRLGATPEITVFTLK